MEELRSAQSSMEKRGRCGRALDIEMLLSLRQPTIRASMHGSPAGALLTISSQSKRRLVALMEHNGVSSSNSPLPEEVKI